jgi:hypothetical protein
MYETYVVVRMPTFGYPARETKSPPFLERFDPSM